MIRNHAELDSYLSTAGIDSAAVNDLLRALGPIPADAVVLHVAEDAGALSTIQDILRRLHPQAAGALTSGNPLTAVVTAELAVQLIDLGLRSRPVTQAEIRAHVLNRAPGVPILVIKKVGVFAGHAEYTP